MITADFIPVCFTYTCGGTSTSLDTTTDHLLHSANWLAEDLFNTHKTHYVKVYLLAGESEGMKSPLSQIVVRQKQGVADITWHEEKRTRKNQTEFPVLNWNHCGYHMYQFEYKRTCTSLNINATVSHQWRQKTDVTRKGILNQDELDFVFLLNGANFSYLHD